MRPLTVLSVTSEIYPLIKTGGLADVAGALPGALAGEGVAMTTLVPGYPAVMTAVAAGEEVHAFETLFGGSARLIRGTAQELDLFVLDAPHLYDRPGLPYLAPDGRDWPDNALRFAALARAAAELGRGLVPGFEPDVIHGHDWQAGLTPAYLRFSGATGPATVMTVHNIAFQGVFPSGLLPELGLPWSAYTIDGVEYYGQIGFLKAGLQLADRITTVSPTYASEIQTREGGVGLDGLLRARSEVVSGILNGIDERVWNPAADPLIAAAFDAGSLEARQLNKAALQERLGLRADPEALLFGAVSRLSEQKGLDLVLAALPTLLADGGQLALLGAGDRILEERFRSAARDHPGQVGCVIGYDEALAHQIQAGADALLVPSRFEPCGLTQLCAMRYGNVPVVSRVGGLADTVIDANEAAVAAGVGTGVQFAPVGPAEFARAVTRTRALHRDREAWRRVQRNGMTLDLGWSRPARHYANLYRSCL